MFLEKHRGKFRNDQARLGCLVASDTGMRIGEVVALRWKDVDLDTGVVRVDRAWDRIQRIFKPPKWGKTRRCGMTSRLRGELIRWRGSGESDSVVSG